MEGAGRGGTSIAVKIGGMSADNKKNNNANNRIDNGDAKEKKKRG